MHSKYLRVFFQIFPTQPIRNLHQDLKSLHTCRFDNFLPLNKYGLDIFLSRLKLPDYQMCPIPPLRESHLPACGVVDPTDHYLVSAHFGKLDAEDKQVQSKGGDRDRQAARSSQGSERRKLTIRAAGGDGVNRTQQPRLLLAPLRPRP